VVKAYVHTIRHTFTKNRVGQGIRSHHCLQSWPVETEIIPHSDPMYFYSFMTLTHFWRGMMSWGHGPGPVGILFRDCPFSWLMWWTYYRCFRKHWKCHLLQIELNYWFLHMFHESIQVSLITVRVEQLIYIFFTRCCLLPILAITLQRHPMSTWKTELF
jgi:hypothetical protein